MNLKRSIFVASMATSLLALTPCQAETKGYDWDKYEIPVKIEKGEKWTLLTNVSDDFNYTAKANNKGKQFFSKWEDYYHSNWSGPAPTIWQRDHSYVEGGELKMKVSRPKNVEQKKTSSGAVTKMMDGTYAGCISSKDLVKYPVFVETRMKIANSTMASDVWMLSPDATQEIDIVEAYGSDRDNGGYGADRIHLSHHVFVRKPFQDYQPRTNTWYKAKDGKIWRENYHRVGVYWKNPTHLEYYIDGELVRTVSGMDIIDPKGFTNGTGLSKELHIIINMEDQSWRALKEPSLSPTREELKDVEANTFRVDWVRVYQLEKK